MSFHAATTYSRINELEAENARLSGELDIARRLLLDGEALASKLKGDIASIKHKGLAVLLTAAGNGQAIARLQAMEPEEAQEWAEGVLAQEDVTAARVEFTVGLWG